MSWHLIVLAAGHGRRMGGSKALMPVGGRAWWEVQRDRVSRLDVSATWVVSPEVEGAVRGLRTVRGNPDAPMFESIRVGIAAAPVAAGVLVLPVDIPAPDGATTAALTRAAGAGVAIPTYGGKRGHPVALTRAWITRVFMAGAGVDARLDRLIAPEAVEVAVGDPSVIVNLNTPDDVREWLRRE